MKTKKGRSVIKRIYLYAYKAGAVVYLDARIYDSNNVDEILKVERIVSEEYLKQ
jgi:hypothetical protein